MALELRSLTAAHSSLLGAAPGNHDLCVAGVRVRDASPLRELVRGRRWTVVNKGALSKLLRADSVLALLEVTVLPIIVLYPARSIWLQELFRLGDKLESLGNDAGGDFSNFTAEINRKIKQLGDDIHHDRRTAEARARRARRLIEMVTALRDSSVTIGDMA